MSSTWPPSWCGLVAQHCAPTLSCCAGAAFFWAWRFQQFSRGPKRVLYGWSLPVAKACGNAMKIAVWPVLILPLSYVFTTPLRCTLNIFSTAHHYSPISGHAGRHPCFARGLHTAPNLFSHLAPSMHG
jgi:hypothetical protein